MLKKSRRIPRSSFLAVLRQGKSFHSTHFSLKIKRGIAGEEDSFSFVISKKIIRTAVKRNVVKRRGYHVLRDVFGSIKKPYKGIFFVKKGAGELSFNELKKEILSLLKTANLI